MKSLQAYLWPHFEPGDDALLAARKRLTHTMCLLSGIVSSGYALSETVFFYEDGQQLLTLAPLYIISALYFLFAGLVAKSIWVRTAAWALMVGIFAFTMTMRFTTGFFVPGAVYFMTLPMVGGMLLGTRAGIGLSAVMVLTYVGLFVFRDFAPEPSRNVSETEFALQTVINFGILGVASAASALFFMRVMEGVIDQLRDANTELKNYRDNLERLVEQRTLKIEEQSKELSQALQDQKDMNALQNSLVSMVSHEIRTPLAIIDGTARRIGRQGMNLTKDQLEERSKVIRNSVKRLTELVERTLESARYAEGNFNFKSEEFDLRALLTSIISRELSTDDTHTITADLSSLPEMYCGDASLLDHVFSNVISNAMKYSPDTPEITLRTRSSATDFTITIRDQGIGIPKDELNQIASQFFRASTSKGIKGTGVGLFLTRKIVEDHGGTLTVDSEEGKWTEVSISLPYASDVCIGQPCCAAGKAA